MPMPARPPRWIAIAALTAIYACAGTHEPVATPAPQLAPLAPPQEPPLASTLPLPEWLPASGVLAARIDVVALEKTGPLPALLEALLGEHSGLLDGARRVHVGVEPVAGTERVVLVVEADTVPDAKGEARWTPIARDAWVACVRACEGFVVARSPVTRAGDARAPLLASAGAAPVEGSQELVVAYAAELIEESAPVKSALRDRLLDSAVSVASELRDGSLRMTQTGTTLTTELHARFTSRGVASSASLLTRGAVFEAADELERVGLTREADLLYALSMSLGEDDMTAKLSVPVDIVPALALAWLAARKKTGEHETFDDASAPHVLTP
jgi:hypothetical protein